MSGDHELTNRAQIDLVKIDEPRNQFERHGRIKWDAA
jgi:hypothetical protein